MSEMIERVAKAMFLSRYGKSSGGEPAAESFWPDRISFAQSGWPFDADGYRDSARAAIEAMHEPTEAMLKAGQVEYVGESGGEFADLTLGASVVEEVWQAMVNAATVNSGATG